MYRCSKATNIAKTVVSVLKIIDTSKNHTSCETLPVSQVAAT